MSIPPNFDTLPADMQRNIALYLTPHEIIILCKTDYYKNICSSDDFWRLKLMNDFPEIIIHYERLKQKIKPKNTYMRMFSEISSTIEKHINDKYKDYSEVQKKEKYDQIYNVYQNEKKIQASNASEFEKKTGRFFSGSGLNGSDLAILERMIVIFRVRKYGN